MTRWLVGVVSVCALAGTAATTRVAFAQDTKKEPPAKGQEEKAPKLTREERVTALKKLVVASKTSLVAAIDAAEKKAKGKAYGAAFGVTKDKKLTLHVEVLTGDKLVQVAVDPETGVASEPKENDGDDHDHDHEGKGDH